MYVRISCVSSSSVLCIYIRRYLDPDPMDLSTDLSESMHPKYKSLNHAIASLVSAVNEGTALTSPDCLAATL